MEHPVGYIFITQQIPAMYYYNQYYSHTFSAVTQNSPLQLLLSWLCNVYDVVFVIIRHNNNFCYSAS